jgi:hypothetical protein
MTAGVHFAGEFEPATSGELWKVNASREHRFSAQYVLVNVETY